MGFHKVRFPLDVSLDARGGPERATDILALSSGREELSVSEAPQLARGSRQVAA